MRISFIALFLCFTSLSFGQYSYFYENYEFKEGYGFDSIDTRYTKEEEVVLYQHTAREYIVEDDGFFEYVLVHEIKYINSDKAVEENNKVYIPIGGSTKVLKEECRVITKSGISTLNKKSIRETEGDENTRQYRYFAVESLEKGSIVEFFYIIRKNASYQGNYVYLQSSVPKQRLIYEIISPSHLVFLSKSRNGFPEPNEWQVEGEDLNFLHFEATHIPAIKEELFANTNANKMQLIFRLGQNTDRDDLMMNTYSRISDVIWGNTHTSDKKEIKELTKILKSLKLEGKELKDQIFDIETYVKSNYSVVDNSSDELSNIQAILKNKFCSEQGIVRMLGSLYEAAGIEHEIVLTNDRFDSYLDREFDCYCFLRDYLIYFPEVDDYLQPIATLFRLGLVRDDLRGNLGLFISSTKVGDVSTAISEIREIPFDSYLKHRSDMTIQVRLSDDLDKAEVKSSRLWTGYSAVVGARYSYVNESDRKELDDRLQDMQIEGMTVKRFELENEGVENVSKKPFIVHMDYESSSMLEVAGEALILKVGVVIGPQSQLYQEEKRTLAVDQDNNRNYDRKIEIEIPEGYHCSNLDDLNIYAVLGEESDPSAIFKSTYKVEGNKVSVTLIEYYTQPIVPIEQYDAFAAVVNAAADFNKVKLVFRPN